MSKYIITADWHLRFQIPRCRLDEDWLQTQRNALEQVFNHAIDKQCDILLIGDVFHTPKQPEIMVNIINETIEKTKFKGTLWVLPGNHDMSFRDLNDTAVGVLLHCHNVKELKDTEEFAAVHTLVFPETVPPQYNKGITAKELLEETPDVKWVFTGDYHHSFHVEHGGRHVVNPGCLMRQAADMKDYKCVVAFVDTVTEKVEWLEIKDNQEVVTDSYLQEEKERNGRIEAFAEQIKGKRENISMDFWENIDKKAVNLDYNITKVIQEIKEEIANENS